MAKFQIRSRAWNLITIVGVIVVAAVGFGGLFALQAIDASASLTSWFVIALGIVTFGLFAGPGIVYVARKRIGVVKRTLPGGTMAWIRAHLYLPILALVTAWVHAAIVPFRSALTSGKALLALGVIVSVAGVARHHLIGVQKAAVNARARIAALAAARSRRFRSLVGDYTEARRPLADIEIDIAGLDAEDAATWAEIVSIQEKIDKDFPRGGGQSGSVRLLKVLRASHAPATLVLFIVLAFHVFDVMGGTQAVAGGDGTAFAEARTCGECHGDIHEQWATSSMSHAQTSTIMEAQLPVTVARNAQLAAERGAAQQALFEAAIPTCVNCHAPAAAAFVSDPHALLPLDEAPPGGEAAVSGANEAITADGIGCIVCHTQAAPLAELSGFALTEPIAIDTGGSGDFGTMFGPTVDDPHPLPVRIHDIDDGGVWDSPVGISFTCGACHNVKVDIDGDGLSPVDGDGSGDDDGDFQLNENELDIVGDILEDLVLQTTFDEWQDYLVAFDDRIADDPLSGTAGPLGCIECHMPIDEEATTVDYAPGFLAVPDRTVRSHTFIGVDYDLEPEAYSEKGVGTPYDQLLNEEILPLRKALLASAVAVEVVDTGVVGGDEYPAFAVVKNNVLGHTFPTGFAFARQFWLEVTAETADGQPVCLLQTLPTDRCGSGELEDRHDPVPQCDPDSVADFTGIPRHQLANGDILFADALPVDECDPWLVNFQKILTDGPRGQDLRREVAYQSLLNDIVAIRERMIDSVQPALREFEGVFPPPDQPTKFDALESVRLKEGQDASVAAFPYIFDTSRLQPGTEIIVTVTMRFRHLPPEFIRGLEAELATLNPPESALIDAEELIENLVVTDVVTARTGSGAVVGCEGPQNRSGASLFDCIEGVATGDGAVPSEQASAAPAAGEDGSEGRTASATAIVAVGGLALWSWLASLRRRERSEVRPGTTPPPSP